MIGDKIEIRQEYLDLSHEIVKHFSIDNYKSDIKTISIGGESGSGKSTLSLALHKVLESRNIRSVVLHQDDYFFLPPLTNHAKRLEKIEYVGTSEVNLKLMDEHIQFVKNRASKFLSKPIVHYDLDEIKQEKLEVENVRVVIVEGTYTMLLKNVDIKLFMSKNYKETREYRKLRGRDAMSDFNENVLSIEHDIIVNQKELAHYIIDKNMDFKPSPQSMKL